MVRLGTLWLVEAGQGSAVKVWPVLVRYGWVGLDVAVKVGLGLAW